MFNIATGSNAWSRRSDNLIMTLACLCNLAQLMELFTIWILVSQTTLTLAIPDSISWRWTIIRSLHLLRLTPFSLKDLIRSSPHQNTRKYMPSLTATSLLSCSSMEETLRLTRFLLRDGPMTRHLNFVCMPKKLPLSSSKIVLSLPPYGMRSLPVQINEPLLGKTMAINWLGSGCTNPTPEFKSPRTRI
jgi:hypothetical protein